MTVAEPVTACRLPGRPTPKNGTRTSPITPVAPGWMCPAVGVSMPVRMMPNAIWLPPIRRTSTAWPSGSPSPPGPSRVGALDGLTGFVGAPPVWEALLRRVDPHPTTWDRVIAVLETSVPAPPADRRVRRLTTRDTAAVQGLDAGIGWISNTWGGPAGLAASGTAWAAFHDGSAIAVAVPFFVGDRFEDIGVVTHPGHRRQGLSRARAPAVAADIRTRGHIPTWTTSPDNTGSLAVADRLGFVPERTDVLWAVRTPIPDP